MAMKFDPRFTTSGLALAIAGALFAAELCASYVRSKIHHREREAQARLRRSTERYR